MSSTQREGLAEKMKQRTPEIEIASQSDVGLKRSSNQDAMSVFSRTDGSQLLVVADGMGGHQGGEIASQLAIDAIGATFTGSTGPATQVLREAFQVANSEIRARAQREPHLMGMGTTGVALWLGSDGRIFVAHVGDSRAYRFRYGCLEALTADHSVVGEMLRRGLLTQAEAEVHPRRNELMRSIGSQESLEVDLAEVGAEAGDQFLLCSDGLCGIVDDAEIGAVLLREPPASAVLRLIELANARGGPDNITVQIAALRHPRKSLVVLWADASHWIWAGLAIVALAAAGLAYSLFLR